MPVLRYTAGFVGRIQVVNLPVGAHNHKLILHLHKKVLSGLDCPLDGRINVLGGQAEF